MQTSHLAQKHTGIKYNQTLTGSNKYFNPKYAQLDIMFQVIMWLQQVKKHIIVEVLHDGELEMLNPLERAAHIVGCFKQVETVDNGITYAKKHGLRVSKVCS
jgi:hypothetical protein